MQIPALFTYVHLLIFFLSFFSFLKHEVLLRESLRYSWLACFAFTRIMEVKLVCIVICLIRGSLKDEESMGYARTGVAKKVDLIHFSITIYLQANKQTELALL